MKWYDYVLVYTILTIIMIGMMYFCNSINRKNQIKEQAILNYYQDVETLLDSLYIDCGDTILETDAGAKYLESKYTFDSLFINNSK